MLADVTGIKILQLILVLELNKSVFSRTVIWRKMQFEEKPSENSCKILKNS